jgi:hypothetical protein
MLIERQIGDEAFEPIVLVLKVPQGGAAHSHPKCANFFFHT